MRHPVTPLFLAALLCATFAAPAVSTAGKTPRPKCFVQVNSGKIAAGDGKLLARRLANVVPGDVLHLGGRCTGLFRISRDVELVGDLTPDDTFLLGASAGTVVTIDPGVVATLRGIIVNSGAANVGGGIANDGDLTLGDGALVLGNDGGGILNNGTLLMTGNAVVSGNFSGNNGGGLYNLGAATLEEDAVIRDNTSVSPPFSTLGGGIYNIGTLTLRGNASVRGNFATVGGGIFNDGSFSLEGNASVTENTATSVGGAIDEGGNSVLTVDPGWAGTTCDPANSPNDFDASNGGADCP